MAFSQANLQLLATVGDLNLYVYESTTDNVATIVAADYFLGSYQQFNSGDIVHVHGSDASRMYQINVASSTTVTMTAYTLASASSVFTSMVDVTIAAAGNTAAATLRQNDTTNNPSALVITNTGSGADIQTDSFTITNGLIVPGTSVAIEIQKANNSGNVACFTLDNNDATNNPSTLKIENAGSGKDIETEALSLTNGKVTLVDATGFEIENAATGNAVLLVLDQNDTTGNNTALKIENAGTGADIQTDSFSITNGLIVPVSGVSIEVNKANNSGNVPAFVIDNDDATNNPSSLTIENAGSGADITAPNFTLTAGALAASSLATTGNISTAGKLIASSSDAVSGPDAISVATFFTAITTTGVNAYTLADGVDGQLKSVKMVATGGNGTLTPTNLANGTSLTFAAVNDSALLLFVTNEWHIIAVNGCTINA